MSEDLLSVSNNIAFMEITSKKLYYYIADKKNQSHYKRNLETNSVNRSEIYPGHPFNWSIKHSVANK